MEEIILVIILVPINYQTSIYILNLKILITLHAPNI